MLIMMKQTSFLSVKPVTQTIIFSQTLGKHQNFVGWDLQKVCKDHDYDIAICIYM